MLVCQKDANETCQNSVDVQNQSHNVTIGNYVSWQEIWCILHLVGR